LDSIESRLNHSIRHLLGVSGRAVGVRSHELVLDLLVKDHVLGYPAALLVVV